LLFYNLSVYFYLFICLFFQVKGKKGQLLKTEVDLAAYAANGTNAPKDFNLTSKASGPVLSVSLLLLFLFALYSLVEFYSLLFYFFLILFIPLSFANFALARL
jgi:hypothetical protein